MEERQQSAELRGRCVDLEEEIKAMVGKELAAATIAPAAPVAEMRKASGSPAKPLIFQDSAASSTSVDKLGADVNLGSQGGVNVVDSHVRCKEALDARSRELEMEQVILNC
jgi:hypothetical protein